MVGYNGSGRQLDGSVQARLWFGGVDRPSEGLIDTNVCAGSRPGDSDSDSDSDNGMLYSLALMDGSVTNDNLADPEGISNDHPWFRV